MSVYTSSIESPLSSENSVTCRSALLSGPEIRVRGEVRRAGNYENVGKSQPALLMIDPMTNPVPAAVATLPGWLTSVERRLEKLEDAEPKRVEPSMPKPRYTGAQPAMKRSTEGSPVPT
jgi:hypothetical protein